MAQLSNATLNALQATYFDDYSEDKSFYRILFRPSTAVQARELTQVQSIIQNQIGKFGDHVFKDGSVVRGCAPIVFQRTSFVRTVDNFLTNLTGFESVVDFNDKYLITNGWDSNTSVRATLVLGKSGFSSNYPITNRFYIRYTFTGRDGGGNEQSVFLSGETLNIYDTTTQSITGQLSNNNIVATINVFTSNTTAPDSIGSGFIVSVSDGIIYQKGFFQKVDKQYVVVNDFLPDANSAAVGYETVETIITEYQDSSLNDNSNGSSNYNAPGAHRLKLTPTLVVKTKEDLANNVNFFPVVQFDGNTVVQAGTSPIYNALGNEMAKRTFEESGNYTIMPHFIETGPGTALTSSGVLDANAFSYNVGAGISYINGQRIQLTGTKRLNTLRANTTSISQNQNLVANYGNYVFCKEVVGAQNFDKLGEVALYSTATAAITNGTGATASPSGTLVGYANIKSVVYYSGTKGQANCQYYVYLFNIRMNPGKSFKNDVKGIYASSSTTGYTAFFADPVLESNLAVIYDATFTPMLFDIGLTAIKSLTPTGLSADTSYYFRKTKSTVLNSNAFISVPHSGGAAGREQIYDTSSRDYNIILGWNVYTSDLTSTISTTSSSNVVTGSATKFESELKIGDKIRVGNGSVSGVIYTISTIASNTILTLTSPASGSTSANVYQKYFPSGSYLPITDASLSVVPGTNTFTVSNSMGYYANGLALSVAFGAANTVYAQYPVQKNVVQAAKTLNRNRLIKIDCSNNVANSVGPWSLGLPDVLTINHVWVGSGSAYSNSTSDYASWFKLDNGQKDDSYDLATISVLPQYRSNIVSTTTLLVDVDFLQANTSSGIGFFSIDSYPIHPDGISSNTSKMAIAEVPVYSSKKNAVRYDLRNAIDFRPSKALTANNVANTDYANAYITINPAVSNSNTWSIDTNGQYHPEVDSVFQADYEYYLPRYDLVLMNENSLLSVSSSAPEKNPKLPLNTTDSSVIAEAYVPEFPSLTMKEAETYNRPDLATKIKLRSNRRYTMKDISVLEDRISKLEYYTVLSILEKAAKDMSIPDASGLDRFKNGIFADPFNSHLLGSTNDIEYKIAIDEAASILRPDFQNHLIDLQYTVQTNATVTQKGPYVTLPYINEKFAEQPYATKYRNCTEAMWSWKGKVILSPSADVFTDQSQAPAINQTMDMTSGAKSLLNSVGGKIYGATSASATSDVKSSTQPNPGGTAGSGPGQITTNETTTTTTLTQEVTSLSLKTTTSEYNIGNFVSKVGLLDYMRESTIAFYARDLKPNSKLHVFFDEQNVDAHVAPGTLTVDLKDFNYNAKGKSIVTTTGPKGITSSNPLVANSSGGVAGHFTIPAGTFRMGDRKFLIANVDDLKDSSAIMTKAETVFYASGLSVTNQSSTLTTINPEIVGVSSTLSSSYSTSSTATVSIPAGPPPVIYNPTEYITNTITNNNYVDVPVPYYVDVPVPYIVPLPIETIIKETTIVPVPVEVVKIVEKIVEVPVIVPLPVIVPVATPATSSADSCFVAGSLVTLENGSKINIEDVKIGDRLKGETAINTVLAFDHPKIGARKLYGFNGNGRFVTAEHPLKTMDGWKSLSPDATYKEKPSLSYLDIKELMIGDILITENGQTEIISIEEYIDQNPEETLYNFVLDGDNTYYVNSILAHNKDGGGGEGDPLCQSFTVTLPSEQSSGQFITRVDLYFRSKDPVKGLTVWLVQMANGSPDFSTAFGKVHYESNQVNVSDDASISTSFIFEHPIYVSGGKDYAFIVQPDADSPEYEIWTAETGGFDIPNSENGNVTTQVFKNPYDGIMFVSANRKTWTAFQTEDMKFRLYRARFTSSSGTVTFINEDDEYLTINGLVKNASQTPQVGDVVYSSNSTIANTNAAAPFGIIQYYSEADGKMILDSTRAGFTNTAGSERIQIHRIQPTSNTSLAYSGAANTWVASANVVSVDNNTYHAVLLKFADMTPTKTRIEYSINGTDDSYALDSDTTLIANEKITEFFDKERIVLSRSNEKTYTANVKSTWITAALITEDSLVSPVIDLRRKSSYFIENLINNDVTNEQYTYGNALSKYISKKVVLADGQDAEDLRVTLTAYRPSGANVYVYAKLASSGDPEEFSTKNWTRLDYLNGGSDVYGSTGDRTNFIEYEFGIPSISNTTVSFNANSGVSSAANTISITGQPFTNNQLVYYYNDVGNTAPSGIANNTFYYVVYANSTALCLSNSQGGANLDLTAGTGSSATEYGHYLKGYITTAHNAFLNADNSGIVEYYNNANARNSTFKYFAIKIVLTSTTGVDYPRINDLRAIALQK